MFDAVTKELPAAQRATGSNTAWIKYLSTDNCFGFGSGILYVDCIRTHDTKF